MVQYVRLSCFILLQLQAHELGNALVLRLLHALHLQSVHLGDKSNLVDLSLLSLRTEGRNWCRPCWRWSAIISTICSPEPSCRSIVSSLWIP